MATRVNRWTALLLGLSILAAGASSSGCASRGTNASNMDAADSAGSNQPVDTPPPAELRIVFVSDAGSGTDLYAMRPDGSATIRITVDPETDFGPRVRRDELVFGSLRAGRSILYRIVPGETPAEVYRNPGLYGADVSSVARLHLKAGREELALQLLLREKSNLEQAGLALLAGLLKRSGQLRGACAIWKTLAAGGDQAARVRLAKHYEHDLSDYARALDCADGLCESDEKQRRCSRLRHKLGEIDRQSRFEYG